MTCLPSPSTSGQEELEELPWDPQGHDPLPAEGTGPVQGVGADLAQGSGSELGWARLGLWPGRDGNPCRRSTSLGRPYQRQSLRMPSASTTHWPLVPTTTARGPMCSTCAQLTGEYSSSRLRECPLPAYPNLFAPLSTFFTPLSLDCLFLSPHPDPGLAPLARNPPWAQVPSGCTISLGAWSRCSPGSLASMWWLPCSLLPPSQLLLVPRRSSAALCCPVLPPASLRYPQFCPPGQWDRVGLAHADYTQGYHV